MKTFIITVVLCLMVPIGSRARSQETTADPGVTTETWQPLLGQWEACDFGGDGQIDWSDAWTKPAAGKTQAIESATIGVGEPISGIRWKGDFPTENYELRLRARRVEGMDFFAAVTFPIGQEHCSLVLGGWGGGVLGISSIDGQDASENETTQFKQFKNGEWVAIRIRVTDEKLEAFLDDASWVDLTREDHRFGIRFEMDAALPMGIANYQCVSEIEVVELRKIAENE